MKRWLSKIYAASHLGRPRTTQTKRRQQPLALERLEDRWVPTVLLSLQEAGVNGGAPTVVATAADFTTLSYSGTYGDFKVTVFGGASDNDPTLSDLLSSTTKVQNIGASAATLNMTVFQDNYTLPAGSPLTVESGLGGSVNAGKLSLSNIFQAYASSTNDTTFDFTNGPQTASQTGTTFDTGSATGFFNPTAGKPYALSSNAAINLTAGGQINFSSHVDVTASPDQINTTAGPTVVLGSGTPLTDSATLSGLAGANPGGSVTFNLYAPSDTSYSNPIDTEQVTVNGNGTYSTPNGFVPTATTGTGTYQWIATYSGDSNNPSVNSGQGNEPENAVDAIIQITPLTPVNEVGNAETFTVTATAFPAGAGAPTFATPTVAFPGGAPGTVGAVTPLAGPTQQSDGSWVETWTETIDSDAAGTFNVQASDTVTMGGVS